MFEKLGFTTVTVKKRCSHIMLEIDILITRIGCSVVLILVHDSHPLRYSILCQCARHMTYKAHHSIRKMRP